MPPSAGGSPARTGLSQRLLRHRHAVGEHVQGALAGGQLLEPLHLGLDEDGPAVQRGGGLARQFADVDLLVEQTTLGEQVITLLLHHVALLPRDVEAGVGRAIE